jgi:integrase
VFAGIRAGRPIDADALRKAFERVCQVARLKNLRIHDLRHSYAATGAGLGLGLPLIGAILGHRQHSTTARYAHVAANPAQQAADIIAGQLAGKILPSRRTEGEEAF